MELFDLSLVNWSRAQFALTAMYHWLFVPLTLGLSFIIAFMETLYVKTGKEEWKKITKFWMRVFGVNFAIGVSTGIILEFQFGTNWSNYSWFVGDIFGAPLAVEGILAFFMESTFIAVMFFGWNKVSKRFHLASTWLVFIGANLSALWILVANGWMQEPLGMYFNPETARNEMSDFWAVLFSPTAMSKFFHTVTSGFVLASVFVIGISSWFLLKKRELVLAKKSILIAATFGIISSLFLIYTGDTSAKQVARTQPMKLAAMEALNHGQDKAPLILFGVLKPVEESDTTGYSKDFYFKAEVPSLLSLLIAYRTDEWVPGIEDIVQGNEEHGILSYNEKISRGVVAHDALIEYKLLKDNYDEAVVAGSSDVDSLATAKEELLAATYNNEEWVEEYFNYFGYSYFEGENPYTIMPNVPLIFYSFHIMVGLGFAFLLMFMISLFLVYKKKLDKPNKLINLALIANILLVPCAYLASELGWVVAEVGRQPWVIQDIMPTQAAVSNIQTSAVQTTFILFAVLFTILAIAEVMIMRKQILLGSDTEKKNNEKKED